MWEWNVCLKKSLKKSDSESSVLSRFGQSLQSQSHFLLLSGPLIMGLVLHSGHLSKGHEAVFVSAKNINFQNGIWKKFFFNDVCVGVYLFVF